MKNLLKIIVCGITMGIALLMIGYISIYHTAGQETFLEEISKLGKIEILQSHLIIAGISGMLITLAVYYVEVIRKSEQQSTYKNVFSIILLFVSTAIAAILIDMMNKNIADMMIIIEVVGIALYILANCAREVIDEFIINKKIREKNSQPEKGN